jgi:hypothetical protein
LDAAKPLIDAMLREDLDVPRKQRHTARRVLARLVDEHQLEVSYPSVRDHVARRRPEITAEAGRATEREETGPHRLNCHRRATRSSELFHHAIGPGRARPAARRRRGRGVQIQLVTIHVVDRNGCFRCN